jgi:hypothetical protein
MRIVGTELDDEVERLCVGDGEGDEDVSRREGKSAWMICIVRTADMVGGDVDRRVVDVDGSEVTVELRLLVECVKGCKL